MNLVLSVLVVVSISSAHGQDLSSPTIDTSSSLQTSSGIGGGAEVQVFRDRFTVSEREIESPKLPGPSPPPSNGTNSTDSGAGSSVGSGSVGFSSSTDNARGSMSGENDQVHSVGSGDEDSSIEYDPTSSNGLDGSSSGSVIFSNEDTSASSTFDAASDAISTRSVALCVTFSLAMTVVVTLV